MTKILGNNKKGQVFVMSAPSGTGKTTLANMLFEEFPEEVVPSISCTTRSPRPNEKDGVDYHFLTKDEFLKKNKENAFLEHAKVFEDEYGTLASSVEAATSDGKHVLLVIDTKGAMQIKSKCDATFIFVAPPSREELEKRLRSRNTENEEVTKERLSFAQYELDQLPNYDYLVINDDLEIAYQVLRGIIIAEEHKEKSYYG